jgi:hypothetical protein
MRCCFDRAGHRDRTGAGAVFWPMPAGWPVCAVVLAALLPADPRRQTRDRPGSCCAGASGDLCLALSGRAGDGVCLLYVTVCRRADAAAGNDGGEAGGFIGVAMPLVSIAVSLTLGVWLLGGCRRCGWCRRALPWRCGGFRVCGWDGGRGAMRRLALGVAGQLGIVQGASFAALAELNPRHEDRARGRRAPSRNWATWAPPPARRFWSGWFAKAGERGPCAVPDRLFRAWDRDPRPAGAATSAALDLTAAGVPVAQAADVPYRASYPSRCSTCAPSPTGRRWHNTDHRLARIQPASRRAPWDRPSAPARPSGMLTAPRALPEARSSAGSRTSTSRISPRSTAALISATDGMAGPVWRRGEGS